MVSYHEISKVNELHVQKTRFISYTLKAENKLCSPEVRDYSLQN